MEVAGCLCGGELAYHKIKGAVGEVSVEGREEAVAKKGRQRERRGERLPASRITARGTYDSK